MWNARKIVRWSMTTLLALSLLPILNLNVERLAESKGWDKILSDHWGEIMSDLSRLATDPWFFALVAFLAGGTLFMWGDYFLRRFRAVPNTLTQEQILDLYSHIQTTKEALDATDDGVTYEGFHEAAALSIKLMKLGIPTPFMPELRDKIQYETFSKNFYAYLAAIGPHVRDGNIRQIRRFAADTIKISFKNRDDSINQDEALAPQSPLDTEQKTQP